VELASANSLNARDAIKINCTGAITSTGNLKNAFLNNMDFTNILRAAFTLADPKSAKKTDALTVFFALLGPD
jgi:hypothetical protein